VSAQPRTALTTGANSGLGLATVLELAKRGHRSIGTVRSEGKAELVHAAAEAAKVSVEIEILDVNDAEAASEVVNRSEPEILVNNAGFMIYAAVEEVSDGEAAQLLETLVLAPTRLARLSLPHMRENKWGRIIQISSISARSPFPLMGWYQGAKMALEGVTDALRVEVASSGISVVLIQPGLFRSELSGEVMNPDVGDDSIYRDAYDQSKKMFGMAERFMSEPEAVAKVVGKAADTRTPRARYAVGVDAQLNVLNSFLPTSLRDQALRRTSGL
jgi:NAD(P)-dependent dehydrogenase (short-subunit alcohol dehydrogenase family)